MQPFGWTGCASTLRRTIEGVHEIIKDKALLVTDCWREVCPIRTLLTVFAFLGPERHQSANIAEIRNYDGAALPDASELHNPQVERVCRKYLELRYRLLPYLYSSVREGTLNGMPVMRALWLHFPDDPRCAERGDEYLWGAVCW
jgi:hypothetical protein